MNNNEFNCLEFRLWPKSYQLGDKISPRDGGFEVDDTYYFGIRIKNVSNSSAQSKDEMGD